MWAVSSRRLQAGKAAEKVGFGWGRRTQAGGDKITHAAGQGMAHIEVGIINNNAEYFVNG